MDLWHAGALGMVETHGLTASIVAVDVMTKAAEVTVIGVRRVGGGLVAVSVIGDMASVTAAVQSARRAVAAVGGTLTATVIGRPAVPAAVLRPADGPPAPDQPAADDGRPETVGDPPAADQPAAGGERPETAGDQLPADQPPTDQPAAAGGQPAGGRNPKRRATRSAATRRRPPVTDPPDETPDPPTEPPVDRPRRK